MRIYLAARYSRRVELCGYRKELESLGHIVTSRWLNGTHQIADDGRPIGDHGEALVEGDDGSTSERAAALRERFAEEDIADVLRSDCIISFTEPPRSNASRGGRHVEHGIALGLWMTGRKVLIVVIGHRENIFHWLDETEFFPTWEEFLKAELAEAAA